MGKCIRRKFVCRNSCQSIKEGESTLRENTYFDAKKNKSTSVE